MFGDFEDLETGEVHSGKTADNDCDGGDDEGDKSDADGGEKMENNSELKDFCKAHLVMSIYLASLSFI